MLSDFYPIPVKSNSTNLGLSISIPEIVVIVWVFLLTIDEIREVNVIYYTLTLPLNVFFLFKLSFSCNMK